MKVNINVDIYSAKVVVVTSFSEFKKLSPNADHFDKFITIEKGNDIVVFVNNEWGNMYDHRFIQCLSHELNHAAMIILYHSGVRFDYKNQEVLCYLQDFLIGRVFKAINKKTGK